MSLSAGTEGGNCWNCGNALESADYGRQEVCSKCNRYTHACKNCEFHDRAYNNECRESAAERVVDKEKFNFCDYFKPKSQAGAGAKSKDALKAAAEALFKKK